MYSRISRRLVLAALAAAALAPALPAQGAGAVPPRVKGMLDEARRAEGRGDYEAALGHYQGARRAAHDTGADEAEADAALKAADLLRAWIAADATQQRRWPDAVTLYEDAVRLGSPPKRALARNNLGIAWLRQKKYPAAVKVLRQIDPADTEPAQQPLYQYNLARALELSGEPEAAYQLYLRVVAQRPDFEPASQGAFRVLLGAREPRAAEVASLARALVAKGQAEVAVPQLWKALDLWGSDSGARRLLAELLRSYVAAGLDPPHFEKTELGRLKGLAKRFPESVRAIDDIGRVYLDAQLPAVKGRPEALELFPGWAAERWQAEALSLLLKKVGDFYAEDKQAEKAFARYTAAGALDPGNTAAPLATALLLQENGQRLDPKGQYTEQLLAGLDPDKGATYQVARPTPQDLQNLQQTHFVLGKTFERAGRLGTEGDPRSAIGQWAQAQRLALKAQEKDPQAPPSPGLHAQLAEAYTRQRRRDAAWDQYLHAAEGYVHYSKPDKASDALTGASKLGRPLNPDETGRLERLTQVVDRQLGVKIRDQEEAIKKVQGEAQGRVAVADSSRNKIADLNKLLATHEARLWAVLTPQQVKSLNERADPRKLPDLAPEQRSRMRDIDASFNKKTANPREALKAVEAERRAELLRVLTPQQARRLGDTADPRTITDLSPGQRTRMRDIDISFNKKAAGLRRQLDDLEGMRRDELLRVLTPQQAGRLADMKDPRKLPDLSLKQIDQMQKIDASNSLGRAELDRQSRELERSKAEAEKASEGSQRKLDDLRNELKGLAAKRADLEKSRPR